jgi:hypothetical protein
MLKLKLVLNVVVGVVVEFFLQESGIMKTASVVFEHQFDQETLSEFTSLRMIRLSLAQKQLADLDQTMSQMKSRGLIESSKVDHQALKQELTQKIELLKFRNTQASDIVFVDEIEFYLSLIQDESESQSVQTL